MQSILPKGLPIFALAFTTVGMMSWEADAASRGDLGVRGYAEEIVQSANYGTPTFMKGEYRVRAPANDAVAVARTFLRSERSTVGILDPDNELEVTDIIGPDEYGMTHVKFAHQVRGLPVFGSELVVHMRGNVVTSMNGVFLHSFQPRLQVDVGGDLAADLAIEFVWDRMERGSIERQVADRDISLDIDDNPELGFFNQGLLTDERTPTQLAWKVSVNGYVVFVDARDGRVLESWDTIHSAMNREVYDVNHGTNLPGQLVCKEGQACNTTDVDARGVWNSFDEIYSYFRDTHGRDSWDGKGAKMIGSVHYSNNFYNAYWSGSQMVFGDDMVALDVTAHELGHGVCQSTVNLTYKYQPGALNESLSDVWGVMVDSDDWLVGEDLPKGAIRSMADPEAYSQPKDMSGYKRYFLYDSGGVHINSGIPNYAAYLLSAGGVNQGVAVRAQGRPAVEKIWYRTEVTGLTSSAKFADFARAAIAACEDIYGKTANQCTETENAFKATQIL